MLFRTTLNSSKLVQCRKLGMSDSAGRLPNRNVTAVCSVYMYVVINLFPVQKKSNY